MVTACAHFTAGESIGAAGAGQGALRQSPLEAQARRFQPRLGGDCSCRETHPRNLRTASNGAGKGMGFEWDAEASSFMIGCASRALGAFD